MRSFTKLISSIRVARGGSHRMVGIRRGKCTGVSTSCGFRDRERRTSGLVCRDLDTGKSARTSSYEYDNISELDIARNEGDGRSARAVLSFDNLSELERL
jgi:hypothetical protein